MKIPLLKSKMAAITIATIEGVANFLTVFD